MKFKYPIHPNYTTHLGGTLDKTFGHLIEKYPNLKFYHAILEKGHTAISSDNIESEEQYDEVFNDFLQADIYMEYKSDHTFS